MNEINLNNIPVDKMSPEQKAKLLEDLSRSSSPDIKVPVEDENQLGNESDRVQVVDEKSEKQNPRVGLNVIPLEKPSQEIAVSKDNEKKGILNNFFDGKESFEDLIVDDDNAVDVLQETIDRKKAA